MVTFIQNVENRPTLAVAAAYFALEWLSGLSGYGFFGDELYYLACAAHPALGYIDHPPLSIWLLQILTAWGSPLWLVRLPPALAGGATIVLASLIAVECGGGRFARTLTALATAGATVLGVIFGFYSMNAYEIALLTFIVWTFVRLQNSGDMRLWLVIGAAAGIALLNKHTAALHLGALGTIFLVTRRQLVLSRWTLGGAAVCALIFSVNLYWQAVHGWPSLEFYRNATLYKNIDLPFWKVIVDQILAANPLSFLVLAAGALSAFKRGAPLRFAAGAYLILLAALALSGSSRPDRVAALLPAVFAGGALYWEKRWEGRVWYRRAITAATVAGFLVLMPVAFPILPAAQTAAYADRLGVVPKIEKDGPADLPQWFADRLGWEDVAAAVDKTQSSLTRAELLTTVIIASDYAYASAVERYGIKGVPVLSGHNSWFRWQMPGADTTTAIFVGYRKETMREFCGQLEEAAVVNVPLRKSTEILICRKPRESFKEAWPQFRHFL